jgi:hypothetical protein
LGMVQPSQKSWIEQQTFFVRAYCKCWKIGHPRRF